MGAGIAVLGLLYVSASDHFEMASSKSRDVQNPSGPIAGLVASWSTDMQVYDISARSGSWLVQDAVMEPLRCARSAWECLRHEAHVINF
jgi:hypothetical protein